MFRNLINKIVSGTKKVVTLSSARTSSGEFLLKKTDFGFVRVEFAVVKKIAERVLRSVDGIQEAEVTVEKLNELNPLRIVNAFHFVPHVLKCLCPLIIF